MASSEIVVFLALLFPLLKPTGAQIGVCYVKNADNLPSDQSVVDLCKVNGISRIRLYQPDEAILKALRGSGIGVMLGVPNDSLQLMALDASAAWRWVQTNVIAYASSVNFRYIAVGNEIKPRSYSFSPRGGSDFDNLLPAMQNVHNALAAANLTAHIKVSTAVEGSILSNSFPPSSSTFTDSDPSYDIRSIIDFLKSNESPLLVNIYPYFSYLKSKKDISLDYAIFKVAKTMFTDSGSELVYQNLFDSQVDAFYFALKKAGGGDVGIVVSETGWPSNGSDAATIENAKTYYNNVIMHVKYGTPMKPRKSLETYLYALFDENVQGNEIERHFGLFTPFLENKFPISFSQQPTYLFTMCDAID